jgi:hypothetical protein
MDYRHCARSLAHVNSAARRFFPFASMVIAYAVVCSLAPAARGQTPSPPQYVFGDPGGASPSLITYTVDPTSGALTLTADPPASPKTNVLNMTVNPAATLLFTTTANSAGQSAVGVFTIASNGSLAEVATSPFSGSTAGAAPITCAVSRDGNYLYLLSYLHVINPQQGTDISNSVLDVFSVGAGGALTIVNTYTIVGMAPYAMVEHATGSWLYVWGNDGLGEHSSSIEQFTVGLSGTLTDNGPFTLPPFALPSSAIVADNLGTFLYTLSGQFGGGSVGLMNSLAVNSVDGSLSAASTFNNTTGEESSNLAIASTSNYLYSTTDSYSIANGVLTLLDNFTPPGTNVAPSLFASPITPFLFETGETAPIVVPFLSSQVIGTDGSLTNAPGSPYPTVLVVMAVTGTAPIPTEAIVRPNPTSVSFSDVVVGQTARSVVTLTNWGYSPLILSNASVSGDPSLSQTNTCASPVAPMATCQVTISFIPTSANTFSGTLTLESNAPTEAVSITAMSLNPHPVPAIVPSQQVLLPDTAMGKSSTVTIQLENEAIATAPLTISSIMWAGSNPGDFSETDNCTSPIAVGAVCSINVTFTPQALGNRAAYLNIATNSPGGITQATVSGNAVTAVTMYSFTTVIDGPGTIAQTPAGTSFANNTTITVTATPNANSAFLHWTNICTSGNPQTCSFVLNANTVATATFAANVTLTTSVLGPGTITQSTPGTSFTAGYQVVLTAVPNANAQFVGWTSSTGCFPGTPATECIVTLNSNTTVIATFTGPPVSLSTSVVGPGTIQQTPPGTSFSSATPITLTAVPNANATFSSWSGVCASSTNPVCIFTITANTTATATFAASPAVTPSQPSQSGTAGSSFTFQINTSGFSVQPTLSATCSIPQGNCAISGTELVVTTTARSSSLIRVPSLVPNTLWRSPSSSIERFGLMFIFGVGIFLALASRRTRRIVGTVALVGGLALLAACGGGNGGGPQPSGTPANTYPVVVKAVAGAQTATSTVDVIVQ